MIQESFLQGVLPSVKRLSLQPFYRILLSTIPDKSHLVPGSPGRKVKMMYYENHLVSVNNYLLTAKLVASIS